MNIRFPFVLLFFGMVMLLTILIYPQERDMAALYIANGDIAKAQSTVDKALAETTPDFTLYMTASEVYHLLGKPEKSIALLAQARMLKPRNLNMLKRLAQYLEWDMRPQEAVAVYEDIAKLTPNDTALLRTMISHYRYFGMPNDESRILALLIPQTRPPQGLQKEPLLVSLQTELESYAEQRLQNGPDVIRDFLMQRLFIVGDQYKNELIANNEVSRITYAGYCLEYYLQADQLALGKQFAKHMDKIAGGEEVRLRLATIMQWNFLFADAVAYLKELAKELPHSEPVFVALARASRELGDLATTEQALERLTALAPANNDYKTELAEVYMTTNKFAKAVNLFDKLLASTVNTLQVLGRYLTAALFSGEPAIMQQVATKAEQYPTSDEDILDARIELWLALDNSLKAYPLLKERVIHHEGRLEDVQRLIEVASYTNTPAIVVDALSLALRYHPDNPTLLEQGALAYITVEQPENAYKLYKRLAQLTGKQEHYMTMLETAGFTANMKLLDEAAPLATKAFPNSLDMMRLASEVLLWAEAPRKALPYATRAAEIAKGDKTLVMNMVEVASFTGDAKLFRNALIKAGQLRPDDIDIALATAQALATDGDTAAFESLLAKFMQASGRNRELIQKWARIADEAGMSEQAFRLYNQLWDGDLTNIEVRDALIRLADWTGRYRVGATILATMSDASPTDAALAEQTGDAWGAANEPAKALRFFERAVANGPTTGRIRKAAQYSVFTGQYAKAVTYFEQIGIPGLTQEERFLLADAYLNTNHPAKAVELFEPLLAMDPIPKDRSLNVLRALVAAGQVDRVQSVVQRLMRSYGNDAPYLSRIGAEAFFAGQLSQALALFEKVLENKPEDATALKGSAMIYAENNNVRGAIQRFREYNKRYPKDGDARYRLAELYTVANRPGAAMKEYKHAARLLRGKLKRSRKSALGRQ